MGKTFTPELHLEGEYLKFFRKLRGYLNGYTGSSKFFNDIEGDIGEMFYTAQKDGKLLKDIIGDNEDEYILELLRTFYEVNPKKKIMNIKIGLSIIMSSCFALIGFTLTRSVLVSIFTGSIGGSLNILFLKNVSEGLDIKAIKYMKVMNIIMGLLFLPVFIAGIYTGYIGESKNVIVVIMLIGVVGWVVTKVGNYNKKSK